MLKPEERERYARHTLLPEVGVAGQERLKCTSVLCVGAGGLGSPLLLYLAAAGVGHLGIVDSDTVDVSNLQRQILHGDGDIGRLKTESAQERLQAINPFVTLTNHPVRLNRENALSLLQEYDIVVDGSDNFPTRYLVNDACVLLKKPCVHGAIYRFEGQISVFDATQGPCYRCLFPKPPSPGEAPSCQEAGVLGVLPGVIGTLQATEVLKLALGIGEPLRGRLLLYDALRAEFRNLTLRKRPNCPVCGTNPTIQALDDEAVFCPSPLSEVTSHELQQRLEDSAGSFVLIDVREAEEFAISHLPTAKLLPLSTLETRWTEIPHETPVILYCRGGGRSAQALQLLREKGLAEVAHLRGGILAWRNAIDPTLPVG
jgi:adenylyltransferase/sulfurtransferase